MAKNETLDQTQITYNTIAKDFSRTRQKPWPDTEYILQALDKYIPNPSIIIDLGCGDGRLLKILFDHYTKKNINNNTNNLPTLIGVDYSSTFIADINNKIPYAQTFCCDMISYLKNQQQESTDAIITLASFHHLTNNEVRQYCSHLIHRCLRYGGIHISINRCLSDRFVGKYRTFLVNSWFSSLIRGGITDPWTVNIPYMYQGIKYERLYSLLSLDDIAVIHRLSGMTICDARYSGQSGAQNAGRKTRRNSVIISQKKLP